jgi:hypothetical protein
MYAISTTSWLNYTRIFSNAAGLSVLFAQAYILK